MVSTRESLLTPSAIKLYGRIIAGLTIDVANARDELGGNRFLREQLERPAGEPKPALARIYGFSYFGRYTALSHPAIFLVHGDGVPASPRAPIVSQRNADNAGALAIDPLPGNGANDPATTGRFSTGPTSVDLSGQAVKCCEFSSDLLVWEYDRGDFSLRMDIDSGPLERILIEAELGSENDMPYFRGSKTRLRGSEG
jgi:hypothetical protein